MKSILGYSYIDLPTGDEIVRISSAEEKRKLLPENEKMHYPDFRVIKTIYKYYGIDASIFDNPDLAPQHISN